MEAALGRRYLWILAFNLSLTAAALVLLGPTPREIGWPLALALSAALYGSNVGLAAIRGFTLLILGCVPMAIAQITVIGTSGAATAPELIVLLAVQLVGAAAFRLFAAQRWRKIDWLRFRPLGNNIL